MENNIDKRPPLTPLTEAGCKQKVYEIAVTAGATFSSNAVLNQFEKIYGRPAPYESYGFRHPDDFLRSIGLIIEVHDPAGIRFKAIPKHMLPPPRPLVIKLMPEEPETVPEEHPSKEIKEEVPETVYEDTDSVEILPSDEESQRGNSDDCDDEDEERQKKDTVEEEITKEKKTAPGNLDDQQTVPPLLLKLHPVPHFVNRDGNQNADQPQKPDDSHNLRKSVSFSDEPVEIPQTGRQPGEAGMRNAEEQKKHEKQSAPKGILKGGASCGTVEGGKEGSEKHKQHHVAGSSSREGIERNHPPAVNKEKEQTESELPHAKDVEMEMEQKKKSVREVPIHRRSNVGVEKKQQKQKDIHPPQFMATFKPTPPLNPKVPSAESVAKKLEEQAVKDKKRRKEIEEARERLAKLPQFATIAREIELEKINAQPAPAHRRPLSSSSSDSIDGNTSSSSSTNSGSSKSSVEESSTSSDPGTDSSDSVVEEQKKQYVGGGMRFLLKLRYGSKKSTDDSKTPVITLDSDGEEQANEETNNEENRNDVSFFRVEESDSALDLLSTGIQPIGEKEKEASKGGATVTVADEGRKEESIEEKKNRVVERASSIEEVHQSQPAVSKEEESKKEQRPSRWDVRSRSTSATETTAPEVLETIRVPSIEEGAKEKEAAPPAVVKATVASAAASVTNPGFVRQVMRHLEECRQSQNVGIKEASGVKESFQIGVAVAGAEDGGRKVSEKQKERVGGSSSSDVVQSAPKEMETEKEQKPYRWDVRSRSTSATETPVPEAPKQKTNQPSTAVLVSEEEGIKEKQLSSTKTTEATLTSAAASGSKTVVVEKKKKKKKRQQEQSHQSESEPAKESSGAKENESSKTGVYMAGAEEEEEGRRVVPENQKEQVVKTSSSEKVTTEKEVEKKQATVTSTAATGSKTPVVEQTNPQNDESRRSLSIEMKEASGAKEKETSETGVALTGAEEEGRREVPETQKERVVETSSSEEVLQQSATTEKEVEKEQGSSSSSKIHVVEAEISQLKQSHPPPVVVATEAAAEKEKSPTNITESTVTSATATGSKTDVTKQKKPQQEGSQQSENVGVKETSGAMEEEIVKTGVTVTETEDGGRRKEAKEKQDERIVKSSSSEEVVQPAAMKEKEADKEQKTTRSHSSPDVLTAEVQKTISVVAENAEAQETNNPPAVVLEEETPQEAEPSSAPAEATVKEEVESESEKSLPPPASPDPSEGNYQSSSDSSFTSIRTSPVNVTFEDDEAIASSLKELLTSTRGNVVPVTVEEVPLDSLYPAPLLHPVNASRVNEMIKEFIEEKERWTTSLIGFIAIGDASNRTREKSMLLLIDGTHRHAVLHTAITNPYTKDVTKVKKLIGDDLTLPVVVIWLPERSFKALWLAETPSERRNVSERAFSCANFVYEMGARKTLEENFKVEFLRHFVLKIDKSLDEDSIFNSAVSVRETLKKIEEEGEELDHLTFAVCLPKYLFDLAVRFMQESREHEKDLLFFTHQTCIGERLFSLLHQLAQIDVDRAEKVVEEWIDGFSEEEHNILRPREAVEELKTKWLLKDFEPTTALRILRKVFGPSTEFSEHEWDLIEKEHGSVAAKRRISPTTKYPEPKVPVRFPLRERGESIVMEKETAVKKKVLEKGAGPAAEKSDEHPPTTDSADNMEIPPPAIVPDVETASEGVQPDPSPEIAVSTKNGEEKPIPERSEVAASLPVTYDPLAAILAVPVLPAECNFQKTEIIVGVLTSVGGMLEIDELIQRCDDSGLSKEKVRELAEDSGKFFTGMDEEGGKEYATIVGNELKRVIDWIVALLKIHDAPMKFHRVKKEFLSKKNIDLDYEERKNLVGFSGDVDVFCEALTMTGELVHHVTEGAKKKHYLALPDMDFAQEVSLVEAEVPVEAPEAEGGEDYANEETPASSRKETKKRRAGERGRKRSRSTGGVEEENDEEEEAVQKKRRHSSKAKREPKPFDPSDEEEHYDDEGGAKRKKKRHAKKHDEQKPLDPVDDESSDEEALFGGDEKPFGKKKVKTERDAPRKRKAVKRRHEDDDEEDEKVDRFSPKRASETVKNYGTLVTMLLQQAEHSGHNIDRLTKKIAKLIENEISK